MPYIPLHTLCPGIAEKETRVITLTQYDNVFHLPAGDYAFIELFCNECDCRRVFLNVLMNRKIVATIAYGWGNLSYYRKEFKGFSKKDIQDFKGPALDTFQYQTAISDRVFNMFNSLLFPDKDYLDRIERHYYQFRMVLKAINN